MGFDNLRQPNSDFAALVGIDGAQRVGTGTTSEGQKLAKKIEALRGRDFGGIEGGVVVVYLDSAVHTADIGGHGAANLRQSDRLQKRVSLTSGLSQYQKIQL